MSNGEEVSVSELLRENEQLKELLKEATKTGFYWVKSGADDSKKVRVEVSVGVLRDAAGMLGEL